MAAVGLEFRVLGDVEASLDGRTVQLGHDRQRCVLAVLLVELNRVVTVNQLLSRVWGDRRPQRARNAVSGCVSRLRQVLSGPADLRFVRQADGYRLVADPAVVDLHRFRRSVARARQLDDVDAAAAHLEEALALWRGAAFGALDAPWLNAVRAGLGAERLAAFTDFVDLALRRGREAGVLGELSASAAAHPLDERLAGQLMLALYRGGRQADALHHFERIRKQLAEELGADPSPPLRQLHRRILSADPGLSLAASSSVGTVAGWAAAMSWPVVPRQLPTPPRLFTGRGHEISRLDAVLAEAVDRPVAVVISTIAGTAGVGKTALALHWAHRVADRFRDGQLYVNLRGFGPGDSAVTPDDALRGFLEGLGEPPQQIPASLDAKAARFRSLLAGRRMLVLLDNARDIEQVRPLLPGTAGSHVLVTSRLHLAGLAAAEGAHQLTLDLLPEADARQLLVDRLGGPRVDDDAGAVAQIIARCVRLPLALSIVAAHAAVRPDRPLSAVAAELGAGLDALDGGDPGTDVRSLFSWSYRALSDGARRLFRLLGLQFGPDLGLPAASSLAGLPAARARPLLTELTRAHLLSEPAPGRYAMHDLLRAYASELTRAHDDQLQRGAAAHRLLDYYLHTGHAAGLSLHPHRHPITLESAAAGITAEAFADPAQALAWLATECGTLTLAVGWAAHNGFDVHAWQLAWTLTDFLDRHARWHDQAAVHTIALHCAARIGDERGQAQAHRALGRAYVRISRVADADRHYEQALGLFTRLGDHAGRAHTHLGLSWSFEQQGRHLEALNHDRMALETFRGIGHRSGEARSLNHIGTHHMHLGEHQHALVTCHEALVLFEEVGDRHGQAAAYDSLAQTNRKLGRYADAVRCHQRAVDLCAEIDDHYHLAHSLISLGDTHHHAGTLDAARDAWQRAMSLLDRLGQLGHPDADLVGQRLHRLNQPLDRLNQPCAR